ncbi:unnamed protein product [Meganyctiphanes norvegica]|uniref:Mitochondrial splicing suppressor 51-like C-terminal domain-containing protein n=1 Tax=Meganyctiphanes norvegica TaxID=48144 RepID=A0AAV2SWE3_MEGNR
MMSLCEIVRAALLIPFMLLYYAILNCMYVCKLFSQPLYKVFTYLYVIFAKTVRCIYRLLGYNSTERDLAAFVLQMSHGSPKAYLTLVMLVYSIIYVGCGECGQVSTLIFKVLHDDLLGETDAMPSPTFGEIQYILTQLSLANQSPMTRELLLSLKLEMDLKLIIGERTKSDRSLMCYLKLLLMGSSLYCPHDLQQPTFIKCKSDTAKAKIQKSTNKSRRTMIKNPKSKRVENAISYPITLLYALQMIPDLRLSHEHRPLMELNSLDVHIVTSHPVLESETWESFMYRFPKINELNIVFILQGKAFKKSPPPSFLKIKNRVVTLSVQKGYYHMYFSSPDYADPDIVVVYNTCQEMPASEKGEVHSEISYRNMTHSHDILLVLLDTSEELVKQGAKAVNAARPVKQLVLHKSNPIMGICLNEKETDPNWTEKNYFTCIRRK